MPFQNETTFPIYLSRNTTLPPHRKNEVRKMGLDLEEPMSVPICYHLLFESAGDTKMVIATIY